jgi:hypothetical protein
MPRWNKSKIIKALIDRLDACPNGNSGWREFEDVCIEILSFLFVPPLVRPRIQPRTLSGVQRRDAIFPNRNFDPSSNNWGKLYIELGARMILFEFKNYGSKTKIKRNEVTQTHSYMREAMGRLAVLVSNKKPEGSAYRERLTIFNGRGKEVILFITKDDLKEMLYIKERGEDPSDLLMDLLESFYMEQE